MKKYRLLKDETIKIGDRVLCRIEAVRSFSCVKKGDRGGFIESEKNLSHLGKAWVCDNALVYGNALVFGNARVCGNARVFDNTLVCDNAMVYGNAEIAGDAEVHCDEDYIVFKNWWSSGRYFSWTRTNNKWKAGCFYGTGEDLIIRAYADSEKSGREYERVVNYVSSIMEDEEQNSN